MKKVNLTKAPKAPLFSFGVFREGLRRLRLTAILFSVFLTLSVLLTPIIAVIERVTAPDFSSATLTATTLDAFEHHATFLFLFVLAAPMVALTLFSFLTSRRESDFYHALPYTRTCLYLSLFAAAAASLLFIILVPTVISALIYTLFSKFFYLSLGKLFLFAFGCFVGALSVLAACTLALSLTGTRFASLAVTGMILFLPRLVISMMTGTLEGVLPMVTPGHVAPFFDSSASYVYGFVAYVFPFFSFPAVTISAHAYSLSAIFYTLCLTLVYGALALLAFRRRPSETAEKPAPNRRMQTVIRSAVGLFASLLSCSLLFGCIAEKAVGDSLPGIVFSYVFVFIVYCLYELLTTRSGKKMVRAMPAFSIVLLLNAVLLCIMGGIYHTQLSFTPTKDEIKSVSIAVDPYTESSDALTFDEYLSIRTSSISLSDEETRDAVAKALADCVKTYREKGTTYEYERHYASGITDGAQDDETAGYESMDLVIRTKSGKHYRTVYLPRAEAARIHAKIAEHDTYKEALTSLPTPLKNTLTLQASGSSTAFGGKAAEEAFAVFTEEIGALVPEKTVAWWQYGSESECYFLYSAEMGANTVDLLIDVPQSLAPRTHARFLELAAEEQLKEGTVSAVQSALSHKDAAYCYEMHVSLRIDGESYLAYLSDASDISKAQKAFSLVNFHVPTESESAVFLTVYFWDENVIDEKLTYRDILLVGGVAHDRLDEFLEIFDLQKIGGK